MNNIVEAFLSTDSEFHIKNYGTYENPLFKAIDVGIILNIGNIRSVISDFDSDQKTTQVIDTPGGKQSAVLLTEIGVYELMFRSRIPVAKKFKHFVSDTIKTLQLKDEQEVVDANDVDEQVSDNIKLKVKTNDVEESHNIDSQINKFFDECFEMDDNAITKSIDISGLYRLWTKKQSSREERTALYSYLTRRFLKSKIWSDYAKTHQTAWRGLRMRDVSTLCYTPDDPPNEYDTYIQEHCIIAPGARVPVHLMTEEFMNMKKTMGMQTMIFKKEYNKLWKYLTKFFVPIQGGFVFNNEKHSGGVYGITMKSIPDVDQCHSTKSKLKKKPVYQIRIVDNVLVKTYDSQSHAQHELNGIDVYYYMKNNKHIDGCMLSYNRPDVDETIST